MATNSADINAIRTATTRAIETHWKLFLIEGIVLVILGLGAVAIPPIASLAVTIVDVVVRGVDPAEAEVPAVLFSPKETESG